MNAFIFLPFVLGALAVLQPILNRMMLDERGVAFAAWLNSLVLLTAASFVLGLVYFFNEHFPDYFRLRTDGPFRWWFILPGLMGFAVVFNLPIAIRALGAFPSIIALLLGQLVTSFLYDSLAQNQPITGARILGLILALAGAYLSFRPAT